jgi:3-oxoadipate enol-lactonase
MPTAELNGGRIYYEEHGKGPAIVFAHGAGGNHLSWWQQVPEFSRHFRCVTYDHRGWGLSIDENETGPASFIEDLRSLLDHLEIERTFLVAQSMGGLSCLAIALADPQRVRGLVMANTFAGMRREVWLASEEALRENVRAVWDRRRADGIKRALSREFSSRHRERAFLYKQIRILNEEGPNKLENDDRVTRFRALERLPDSSANRENLAAMDTPVLFIGGEHDEVMPVSLMEIARSLIPESRMVVVPGAGHSVYFEQPELFNHIVAEFFAECSAKESTQNH